MSIEPITKRILFYGGSACWLLGFLEVLQQTKSMVSAGILSVFAILPTFLAFIWASSQHRTSVVPHVVAAACAIICGAGILFYSAYLIAGASINPDNAGQVHVIFVPVIYFIFTVAVLIISSLVIKVISVSRGKI